MKHLSEALSKSKIKQIVSDKINDCYIVWPQGTPKYYELKKKYKDCEHCIGSNGFLFFLIPKPIAIKLKKEDPKHIRLYEIIKDYNNDMNKFELDCRLKYINLSCFDFALSGVKEVK